MRYSIDDYKKDHEQFDDYINKFGLDSKKKNKLFRDYCYCKYKYLCNLDEYFVLKMYAQKNKYRRDYLTKGYSHRDLTRVNKRFSTHSKFAVYNLLKEYYGREIIDLKDASMQDYFNFVTKHGKAVVKPDFGSLGIGIAAVDSSDINACTIQYFRAQSEHLICEEFIEQHQVLKDFSPGSVNTCRFLTFFDGENFKILATSVKFGNGKITDNLSSGGMCVNIDTNTGILNSYGKDFNGNTFKEHPVTHKEFIGVQLPFWKEAIEMAEEIHRKHPVCALWGMDIAITENGPCLVELNNAPGPSLSQMASGKPCGKEVHKFVRKNRWYDKDNNRIN